MFIVIEYLFKKLAITFISMRGHLKILLARSMRKTSNIDNYKDFDGTTSNLFHY